MEMNKRILRITHFSSLFVLVVWILCFRGLFIFSTSVIDRITAGISKLANKRITAGISKLTNNRIIAGICPTACTYT